MSEQQILLSPAAARGDKLSWATRIAYGGGDTACNVVFGMIGTVLTLFIPTMSASASPPLAW